MPNRPPHTFHRLLCSMPGECIFRFVVSALGQSIADQPEGRLSAVPLPTGRTRFPYGIPTGLMLHVVVSTADHKVGLSPDDLAADVEPTGFQTLSHNDGLHT